MDAALKKKIEGMYASVKCFKDSAELMKLADQLVTTQAAIQGIKNPSGSPLQFNYVILTQVVLYGLIIEINLKAINLVDTGSFGHHHDHVSLYNNLPLLRKNEIKNYMSPCFQNNFDSYLEKNKNTFIEWRYSYEKTNLSCDYSFLKELSEVTATIVFGLIK